MNRRIMYLNDRKGRHQGCVALTVDRDGGKVAFQLSAINPMDSFKKEVARAIASGRLLERPNFVTVSPTASNHEIAQAVVGAIAVSHEFPTRCVRSARLWLKNNDRPSQEQE